MRRDPPRRETAPARESEGPPQSPTNTSTRNNDTGADSRTQSSDPFLFPGMTGLDRLSESHRLAKAKAAKEALLLHLGLPLPDHTEDLRIARGLASVERMSRWNEADERQLRAAIERARLRGAVAA